MFTDMADAIRQYKYNTVSSEQFAEFERSWIIYALQEKRYGQAFCEHFNLGNATPLYNFKSEATALGWIQDNYLQK
jgi:hypothetical protein